jgi:hypothetical protein
MDVTDVTDVTDVRMKEVRQRIRSTDVTDVTDVRKKEEGSYSKLFSHLYLRFN